MPVFCSLPTSRGSSDLSPPTLEASAPPCSHSHRAQRLPRSQEAPKPVLGGPVSWEAWPVICVATWPPLAAPVRVGPGYFLEAVPGLGRGGQHPTSQVAHRSCRPAAGRGGGGGGGAEGCPLPLTLDTFPPLFAGSSWLPGTCWPPGALTCLHQDARQLLPGPETDGRDLQWVRVGCDCAMGTGFHVG